MKTAWLRDLEEKVQEASERLGGLRAENKKLQDRVAKLQNRVAKLEAKLKAAPDAEASGWSEERDDIRQRVEKLVDHLGKLLAD
ncbi:MAG: cell division protein ZapB [bacterium]|nr:cell division protein ZapB [bacterium]